jgi:hypothetical protein
MLKRNAHPPPGLTKWVVARNTADGLIHAFGRDDVLDASRKVRLSTKRLITGSIIDQQTIGATRNELWPAFEDILARKNPRGYVRAMVAFQQNVQSPGSVDVDAAYAKLTAAQNEELMLAAAKKMALAKPNLDSPREIDALLENVRNPQVAEAPAEVMVDFPKYLAWKKFPAGTKVTYVSRGLDIIRLGSEELMASRPSLRATHTMDAIDDQQAHVWIGEIVYDSPTGTAHPPHETEMLYPAKVAQSPRAAARQPASRRPAASGVPESTASGEETLQIGGRAIATHWEEVTRELPTRKEVTKTWTSDEIPTGLVRQTTMSIEGARASGRETIVEAVHGTAHDFSAQRDPQTDGPPVIQMPGLLPASVLSASPPPPAHPASNPSPISPSPRLGAPLTPANPPATQRTAASAHSDLLVRYSKLMIRYNHVRLEIEVQRRNKGSTREATAAAQAEIARLEGDLRPVYAAVRANRDEPLTQALDTFEASVVEAEKSLGM